MVTTEESCREVYELLSNIRFDWKAAGEWLSNSKEPGYQILTYDDIVEHVVVEAEGGDEDDEDDEDDYFFEVLPNN